MTAAIIKSVESIATAEGSRGLEIRTNRNEILYSIVKFIIEEDGLEECYFISHWNYTRAVRVHPVKFAKAMNQDIHYDMQGNFKEEPELSTMSAYHYTQRESNNASDGSDIYPITYVGLYGLLALKWKEIPKADRQKLWKPETFSWTRMTGMQIAAAMLSADKSNWLYQGVTDDGSDPFGYYWVDDQNRANGRRIFREEWDAARDSRLAGDDGFMYPFDHVSDD